MDSRNMSSIFIILLIAFSFWLFQFSNARIFTLEMHHRFSEPVKKWSQLTGNFLPVRSWPEKGSIEYYAALAHHDLVLRGRRLSDSNVSLTFSDGNSTFRVSSLGFLHYTTVTLGTPAMKFLVALDTGSDLFWVPCGCGQCASADSLAYNSDFDLTIYDPTGSSTSKNVTCNNDLCPHYYGCTGESTLCPYSVSYVSSDTSTSGILVEDILHLRAEDNDPEFIKAYITFGCGRIQTGSFLDIAAPNGLFGLGFEKISVPSILSREGYIANSFSMCFGHDGTGTISFGDKGSLDQEETPFNVNPFHPIYNITITQIRVGTTLQISEFTVLVDSGTSFTYLVDPIYTRLSDSFHSHILDKRRPADPRIPFEYCYIMSPDANTSLIPSISLTMKGGGQMVIYDPVIVISTLNELVYCLAVIKSQELNIIGQNFMSGYRIVFDREKLVLGWTMHDCHDIDGPNAFLSQPLNSNNIPPAVDVGQVNRTPMESEASKWTISRTLDAPLFYCVISFILMNSCLFFYHSLSILLI